MKSISHISSTVKLAPALLFLLVQSIAAPASARCARNPQPCRLYQLEIHSCGPLEPTENPALKRILDAMKSCPHNERASFVEELQGVEGHQISGAVKRFVETECVAAAKWNGLEATPLDAHVALSHRSQAFFVRALGDLPTCDTLRDKVVIIVDQPPCCDTVACPCGVCEAGRWWCAMRAGSAATYSELSDFTGLKPKPPAVLQWHMMGGGFGRARAKFRGCLFENPEVWSLERRQVALLSWTILPGGKVKEVSVRGEHERIPKEVVACIHGHLNKMRFPASQSETRIVDQREILNALKR